RPAIERAGTETPHLKRGAPDFYPNGAGHRHLIGSTAVGQTGSRRNPMKNGRRRPSCDGTSRMTREWQVRICERLVVKYPGPTRHKRTTHRGPKTTFVRCYPKSGHSADGLAGLNLKASLGPKGFKVTKFNPRHRLGAHSVRRS